MRSSRPLLCSIVESPLVKTDPGYIQHTFKWGIGNKFRSVNANRFSPVHHARPKEVTIPANYFESPIEGIIKFDRINEQWEVFWYEHYKMHAKPFPVKKFGIERSKMEAMKFLEELKLAGRFEVSGTQTQKSLSSSVPSVIWDDRLQMWISLDTDNGYSASKHGVIGAKKLAEKDAREHRKDADYWRNEIDMVLKKNETTN